MTTLKNWYKRKTDICQKGAAEDIANTFPSGTPLSGVIHLKS